MQFTMTDLSCGHKEKCEASSLEEAKEIAQDWALNGDYNEPEKTFWINVRLDFIDDEGDECEERIKVAFDPPEPDCNEDQVHDWQSPEWLGGLKENPGVWGNGGGLIIEEACINCGSSKTTNTWAQDMESGEQGLTSVRYEANKYLEEINEQN